MMVKSMSTKTDEWPRKHRFDVVAYHRMTEMGILQEDAAAELIRGEILDAAPLSSRHAAVVNRLSVRIFQAIGRRAIVGTRQPLRLDEHSEPLTSIAVLAPRDDLYEAELPTARDTLLVIEVCDTELRYVQETKIPLYADHGVTELWLVDVPAREVTVMREPLHGQYRSNTVQSSGVLQIAALPEILIDMAWLFGP
jgi:Uma2 family endonuclease